MSEPCKIYFNEVNGGLGGVCEACGYLWSAHRSWPPPNNTQPDNTQIFTIYIDRHKGIDNIEKFSFSVDEEPWRFKGIDLDIRIEKDEKEPEFASREWVIETINKALKES